MTAGLEVIASCIAGYDPDALRVERARAFVARLVSPVTDTTRVGLRDALGRVLAHDVVSGVAVPAHDNAAMDGYALRGADLAHDAATALRIVGKGLAGHAFAGTPAPGDCVRITTGAVLPAGLDTVVPQELVQVLDGRIAVAAGAVRPGDHVRHTGEDLALGAVALAAGRRLKPSDLGLLASLGAAEVDVLRRPKVAFFSTGDELRPVGEPLPAGCVYDSNRYTILGMLRRLDVEPLDLGVVPDEPAALEAAFAEAAASADAVVTSGGVSVGEADHTKRVMASLGEVLFWQIAMRPGRPMAIGRIGRALLFGLPGNPVAVMTTFYAIVRDALLGMSGSTDAAPPLLRAVAQAPIKKRPGRTEYPRGIASRGADGSLQVRLTGQQGSGMLSSMSLANALVVLDHDRGDVAAGEPVDLILFDGLV